MDSNPDLSSSLRSLGGEHPAQAGAEREREQCGLRWEIKKKKSSQSQDLCTCADDILQDSAGSATGFSIP